MRTCRHPELWDPTKLTGGGRRQKEASPFLCTLPSGKMGVEQISHCRGRWGGGCPPPLPAVGRALWRVPPRSAPAVPAAQLCPEGTHGGGHRDWAASRLETPQGALRSNSIPVRGVLTSVGGTPPHRGHAHCLRAAWQPQPDRDTDTGLDTCLGASWLLKSLVPLFSF